MKVAEWCLTVRVDVRRLFFILENAIMKQMSLELGKERMKQRRKWILQVGRRRENKAGEGMINLRVQPCCR